MNHDKNHKKAVGLPSETVEKTASVLVAIGKGAYRGMKSNGTKTYAKKKMDKNCIFGVNSFPLEIRQTRV